MILVVSIFDIVLGYMNSVIDVIIVEYDRVINSHIYFLSISIYTRDQSR